MIRVYAVLALFALFGSVSAIPGALNLANEDSASILAARKALYDSRNPNMTSVNLWPAPVSQSTPHQHVYFLNPQQFAFKATGAGAGSAILTSAFARYQKLVFSWGTGTFANHPPTGPAAFLLPGLVVNVLSSDETLGRSTNESYTLNVTDDNVSTSFATLTAQTVFGALRGLETFAQMVQYEQNKQYYQMGATLVQDAPRYPYRGIMLDVARHYIPVSAVLATLEAMSYNKLNVMHMHLIDTQSWPLVIESWPRLSGWTAFSNFSHRYTKDDISNIVSFARDRGIRVIPEIDTPSHSDVIKRAYPEMLTLINCNGQDCPTGNTFRSMPDFTRPQTMQFLNDIFTEVAAMFPDEAFHIGGDEFWGAWTHAPTIQAWMTAHNYTSILDAYHFYERSVITMIRNLGKKTVVAWEDIHGFPADHQGEAFNYDDYQDVVLDVWAGWVGNGGSWQNNFEQYTNRNASVILTGPWYVDSRSQRIYDSLWENFYKVDPGNWSGNASMQAKVLGGHVCAWDDAMNGDSSNLLSLLFPVSAAVAEVLWSPQEIVQKNQAHDRMVGHRCRLVHREVPAGPIEIGFCPKEYTQAMVGPLSVPAAGDAMLAHKVAKLQSRIAELEREKQELLNTGIGATF